MRMNPRSLTARWRLLLTAVGAVSVAFAAWRCRLPAGAADAWVHAEVRSLPDDEVLPWLAGFADRAGEASLPLLVSDLGDSRPAVRQAACTILNAEMATWTRLPADRAAIRAAAIAMGLRSLSPESTSEDATAIATQLAVWSRHASCEEVTRQQITLALNGWSIPTVSEEPSPLHLESASQPPNSTPRLLPKSAESARPIELASFEEEVEAETDATSHASSSPGLLDPANASTADDEGWDLAPLPSLPSGSASQATAAAPTPPGDETAWSKSSAAELFAQLPGAEREQVLAELKKRGFTAEQLELARHLASADVAERRAWTAALPRVNGVNTRDWLKWKLQDADVTVRRTAATLLATTRDAETELILRDVAAKDPDAELRRFAAQLLASP